VSNRKETRIDRKKDFQAYLQEALIFMEWSRSECEAIVADYFSMLRKELAGDAYSKATHRKELQPKLANRSKGSIEYKHQNVTAVLLTYGCVFIAGYKPAWNYQSLLEEVIKDRLEEHLDSISQSERKLAEQIPDSLVITDWKSIVVDPPKKRSNKMYQVREFKPGYVNFLEKERNNKMLGAAGEKFVLDFEAARLTSIGRSDLAKDVEWTSKIRGDGAGYDIRSFSGKTDKELFIEVKTTNGAKYQPFLITDREVEFSKYNHKQYSLYRVFGFTKGANIYTLQGDIRGHLVLEPKVYRAKF
jgi:hypothetical protein